MEASAILYSCEYH